MEPVPSSSRSSLQSIPQEIIIVLNVGGEKFKICSSALFSRFPDSRLGKLCTWPKNGPILHEICDDYCPNNNEYFFNRNSKCFGAILALYHTGKLHCPSNVCVVAFTEELTYWGINERYLDECCRYRFFQLMEQVKEEMKEIEDLNQPVEEEDFGRVCTSTRSYLWNIFERPTSSWIATLVAIISITSILVSTVVLALNTMTEFTMMQCVYENRTLCEVGPRTEEEDVKDNWITIENYYFALAEEICIAWFTIEYVTRFVVAPHKKRFLTDLYNLFDLLAILPYYFTVVFVAYNQEMDDEGANYYDLKRFTQVFRLSRTLRIFKLARHSSGLQSFLFTLEQCYKELGMLFLLLLMGVFLFSTLAYYAEKHHNDAFESIPAAFWWAAVTMNVVGLGDIQPITTSGKIISFMCGVCGMLIVGLPIPIVMDNFASYYSQRKKSLKTLRKYQAHHQLQDLNGAGNGFQEIPIAEENHRVLKNPIRGDSRRAKVVVGGRSFEFTWNIVDRIPNSRLSQLRNSPHADAFCDEYIESTNEFYFYRDSKPFVSILNFYYTGKLHLLDEPCPAKLEKDLKYWIIDENSMQSCCKYRFSRKLEHVRQEVYQMHDLLRQLHENNFGRGTMSEVKKRVWNVLENPGSSYMAKAFALVSIIATLLSAFVLTLRTVPGLGDVHIKCLHKSERVMLCREVIQENATLRWIEHFCVSWFGLEYVLRLLVTPDKLQFVRKKLNMLDFLIVTSYILYHLLGYGSSDLLGLQRMIKYLCDILRILRLLRIFRLGKHSIALEALGYTLKSSIKHLGVLLLFLGIAVLVFSTIVFVAESDENDQFISIPGSFWWAFTTMHTLNVGDMCTTTTIGKFVSVLCGLFGLLFLVLPIPIIASNFKEFYTKKMRLDIVQQKCIIARSRRGNAIHVT